MHQPLSINQNFYINKFFITYLSAKYFMIEVYTYTMRQSTAFEKYRKYEKLLHHDPHNATYRRKLYKYKTIASKSRTQVGGSNKGGNSMTTNLPSYSNSNNRTSIPILSSPSKSMSTPMTSSASSMSIIDMINSTNTHNSTKKNDLLKKINDMVEYSKSNNMIGGVDPEQYKQTEMTKIDELKKKTDKLNDYNQTIITGVKGTQTTIGCF